MLLRLARLRFVILRCCIYSILILLFLQILGYFHQKNPPSDELENSEGKFWQKASSEDQSLTDTQRIERIKAIEEQILSDGHNWTNILRENYWKKLLLLNQRDTQNNWKYRLAENPVNKSQQKIFEIHEETLVGGIESCSRISLCFSGFSTTEILFRYSYLSSPMSIFELSMEMQCIIRKYE